MRLTELEQHTIRQVITTADPDAVIYLFGSRADAQAYGGDIDLFVLSKKIDLMAKLDILAQLHLTLGEQKIDLIVATEVAQPITRIAVKTGIQL
jgi:uncharacterized protein